MTNAYYSVDDEDYVDYEDTVDGDVNWCDKYCCNLLFTTCKYDI